MLLPVSGVWGRSLGMGYQFNSIATGGSISQDDRISDALLHQKARRCEHTLSMLWNSNVRRGGGAADFGKTLRGEWKCNADGIRMWRQQEKYSRILGDLISEGLTLLACIRA